jgi:hypothetical protein
VVCNVVAVPLKPNEPDVLVARGDLLMVDDAALTESPELVDAVSVAIAMGTLAPLHQPCPKETC